MADETLKSEDIEKVKHILIEWDNLVNPKAPLSERQLLAIDRIAEAVKQQPLPKELPEGDVINDLKNDIENQKIETVQQFLTSYSQVEDAILDEGKEIYLDYHRQLCSWRDETDEVLLAVEKSLEHLNVLLEQYNLVSNNTNSLHSACQQILLEQAKLCETSQDIKKRLEYFTCLENLQQRLSNPTLSVTSDTFYNILDKLDSCLEYINLNMKYKESPNYSVKFRYCLSKAVNMMKQYISRTLISAKNQVLPAVTSQQNEMDKTDGTNFALFYGRFQAYAFKIKKLIYNLEQRLDNSPEYSILLADCHEIYFTQRKELMSESVKNAIIELSTRHRGDHCTLVRSGCAFLVHICNDEHQMFYQFFNKSTPLLQAYLEGLCLNLYDILRPIVIHVNHLETLAELCSILRLEMLEEHVQNSPQPLEAFGKVVWQLMQDVQERLVFRAHLYLQSDILNYKPSPGDLAYPEKLEMMESIALSLQEQQATPIRRSESRSSLTSVTSVISQEVEKTSGAGDGGQFDQARSRIGSPADLHGMWYPPVRRTLVTLSRLYRCVERPIFQGLSQEALSMCIQSISLAANTISSQKTVLDGKLFEMKHLLILREQVAPFQVDFTVKEMSLDFTKVKSAAYSLLQKRNRLFSLGTNNALLEFLLEGTPTVKELTVDSRKEVDKQLKITCVSFIDHSSRLLASSLINFIEKTNVFLQMATEKTDGQPDPVLRNQPFASPEQIGAAVQDCQRQIKTKLSQLQRLMQLYLANRETELILYRPIKNNIISKFQTVQNLVMKNGYSDEDRIIMALPTHEQILVLLSTSSLMAQQTEVTSVKETPTTAEVTEPEMEGPSA
ncbi:hypothetical protein RUM44_002592 [Polyplax serrata]|uniref:Conserved oligomeric Golgi complex subunit 3 n=1 Tax=Polyplax serrata TaxID=468196 RepID=A0ABR1AF79_POLSC